MKKLFEELKKIGVVKAELKISNLERVRQWAERDIDSGNTLIVESKDKIIGNGLSVTIYGMTIIFRENELVIQSEQLKTEGSEYGIMKVKLGPSGIIIEKQETVERTLESGIILPATQKQNKPKAKVLAAGSGSKEEPMEVKVGDIITYQAIGAREITVEGYECLLINMDSCLWID